MKIITQSTTTFSGNSFTGFIAFVLLLLSSVSFGQTTIYSENAGSPGGTTSFASNTWQNSSPITYTSTGTQSDVRITTPSTGYTGASGGGNIFMGTATTNVRDVLISGINTTGYSSLVLSFGLHRDNTTNGVTLEVSSDGTNFTALTFTQPAVANTWTLVTASGTIPAASNLRIRFSKNNTTSFRIDDLILKGTSTAATITSNAVTGNWSSTGSWVGGVVPTSADNVVIVSGALITLDTTSGGINTRNSGTTTTVNTGGTLATSVQYINNGTTAINGSFQLNAGGFTNSGNNFVYTSGKLLFNNTSSYGVNNTDQYWPTTNGPTDVTILQGGMTLNSGTNRTVTGVFQTAAAITLTGALTLNGTVRINTGGSFVNAPTYGSSSTLIYNTGAAFTRGNEWTTATSGAGYPANVQISTSGTILNMGATSAQASGSITVDASTTLNTTSAGLTVLGSVTNNGTLSLGGDVTLSGTTASNWVVGASATQTNNTKAVFFTGATGTQTITKTGGGNIFFDYLVINKAAGSVQLSSSPATTVTINTTAGDVLQILNAGALDLNGQTLTLNNAGGNIAANAANRSITSTTTGATLAIAGFKSFSGAGTLVINANVTTILSAGFDFGVGKVTINGILQLNGGGYANNGTAPTYASGSTLLFNTGGFYDVHNGTADVAGWFRNTASTGVAQAGVPWNVTISGNTSVRYNTANTDNFPRYINGNLTINSGSALTLGGISGTAGDFYLRGNWSNSGTFNPNSRLVTFNGTTAQTLTGTTTFDYLTLNNSTGLTLQTTSPVAVNQTLTLTSGKITLAANDLTIGPLGSISGASTTNYIVAASTGQLKRTVGGSATLFAVGNTAYNPITFTNSGTADVYGVRVVNATPAGANPTKTVNRQWVTTEAVAGGSILAVTAQYNTGETGAGFAAATDPFIGHYNGTAYSGQIAATITGANPFVAASNIGLTLSPSDLTTGTQYFAIGKDNGLLSVPSKYVITAITPASPTAGSGFSATVTVQDNYNVATVLSANSSFALTSNGNAGTITGTTSGTITSGNSSVVVTGIILPNAGTGVTITATNTSGVVVGAPGTSAAFAVLAAADHISFVGVPSTGNVGVNLTAFTVEARRPDNSVDASYTGNVTITKASGSGVLSGTTTVAAVAGIATFSTLQFDAADTYTLNANSGSFSQITTGNIVVTLAPVVIAQFDFTNSPYINYTTKNTNVGVTDMAISAGTISTNVTTGSNFPNPPYIAGSGGYTSTTQAAAKNFNFTITANTGYQIEITSFQFNALATAAGPSAISYNINNGAATFTANAPDTVLLSINQNTTGLTNLSTVPILMQGWLNGSRTSSGSGNFRLDDVIVKGYVTCKTPASFTVGGGGAYCAGGAGLNVTLSGSEAIFTYQLKRDGNNVGSPVAGTGNALNFGPQATAGNYTVVAINSNGTCNVTQPMTGSATITVNAPPTASVISGTATICSGNSTNLQVAITGGTSPYTVVYTGGTLNSYTSGSNIPVSPSSTTTYTITSVTDANGCAGTGNSGSAVVTVNNRPTASVISGDASICLGSSTNLQVAITGGTSPYTLVYTGGTIPSYTSGTNIPVSPTSTTTYTITSVTDANGCAGTGNSGSAVVTLTTTTSTDGGASWDNGTPTNAKAIVFNGGTGTLSADISGCSLHLTNNASVTVASGNDVTLSGAVIVDSGSTFTLNNNANLLQGGTTNANTGNIVVKRNSSALKRLDYTLWSSPVTGQEVYAFSPFTFANRFYVYRTATNFYNNADIGMNVTGLNADGVNGNDQNDVQFTTGKGYLIRMPWNHPTAPTVWNGTFTGVPNNGDIPFTMTNNGDGFRFNLVGNPYPSPINMTQFVSDNSSSITGTLYFWRETNGTTANNAYCSWAGGTFTTNNQAQVFDPNGIIRTGQGFIVEALNAATSLTFKNGQRSSDNANQFFRTNSNVTNDVAETNRFWLNLTNAAGEFSQMAAGYMTNATDGVDLYDGKNINTGSVLLNSILNNADYTIQGKSLPFNASDVIPLSCKITNAGDYSIAIDHVDGLFTGGTQAIYLKDNLMNTEHNLQTGAYTFTSEPGTFNNRFEIIYQSQLGVGNPVFTANSVVIYPQGNDFVVNSGNVMMSSVKVFDIRGRLLQERKGINASQTTINGGLANEVLLVQILSEDGILVTKKVIR